MRKYEVTLGKGNSGKFKIEVYAQSPDDARRIAEAQYFGYNAQSVKTVYILKQT